MTIEEMAKIETTMIFFAFEHLPESLQEVSKPFCELAKHVFETIPRGPQRSLALRRLIEAKDAAVRAAVKPGH